MKIVFMGTPEFAVPSLRLLAQHHDVVAVFCQPDRPKGRGNKMQPCPVKEAALELGIPVHQPKRIRMKKWVSLLEGLELDLAVVAAFGQILSQKVLDIPKQGCVNVHASLLPRWRGASPIHYAIKERDAQAGVAIMKMELALDAGPVYSIAASDVHEGMGRFQLEKELAELGAHLLVDTIPKLAEIKPSQQDSSLVTYAPIIEKDFGYVDPTSQTADEIAASIRAFEGWPGVYCLFRGLKLKLVSATSDPHQSPTEPGTLAAASKKELWLSCAHGSCLKLVEVQVPGKKAMPAAAFINGYQPQQGEALGPITAA